VTDNSIASLAGPVGVWQLTDEDTNADDPFLDVELVSVAAAMCCLTSKHSYRLAVNSSIPVFVPPNCPVVVRGNKCTVYAGPRCKLSKKTPVSPNSPAHASNVVVAQTASSLKSSTNDAEPNMHIPNTNILVVSVEPRHRLQIHFKDNCTVGAKDTKDAMRCKLDVYAYIYRFSRPEATRLRSREMTALSIRSRPFDLLAITSPNRTNC
jgi:hypothetical protein